MSPPDTNPDASASAAAPGLEEDPTLLRLLGSDERELDCDECFAQLDRYVELEFAGPPADALVSDLRAQLELDSVI